MPRRSTLRSTNETDAEAVSVLLICRVRLYRDAILRLLNRHPGIRATGSGATGQEALADLDDAAPDVVLLDMGHRDALSLAAFIARDRPSARILGFGVENVPGQVVACAEAGLRGYVPASASVGELARAARRVAAGDTICSSEMADILFRHLGRTARGGQRPEVNAVLTARQQEILRLIREGLSNKEIAQRLSLGTSTVKNHIHSLLGRLQVGRRAEAARLEEKPGQSNSL
jgi:DNA-binding NarL/FixJ family response regulator